MENLIVALVVAAAAIYAGRTFYKGFKGRSTCGCGCDSCSVAGECDEEPRTIGK